MNKQDFIAKLKAKLSGLPPQDVEERLHFYSEMIDDRLEEGYSEEEAVADIGSADDVSAQIIADISFFKIAKERIRPQRRLNVWEIVLLAVGSPIWLSLFISAIAVVLSLYVSLWAMILSLWAVFASLVTCGFAIVLGGLVIAFRVGMLGGVAVFGAGLSTLGLSILLFFGCRAATTGTLYFTKQIALYIKKRVMGGEKTK